MKFGWTRPALLAALLAAGAAWVPVALAQTTAAPTARWSWNTRDSVTQPETSISTYFEGGVAGPNGATWYSGTGYRVLVPNWMVTSFGAPTLTGNSVIFNSGYKASSGNPFRYLASLDFTASQGLLLQSIDMLASGTYQGGRPSLALQYSAIGTNDSNPGYQAVSAATVPGTQWGRLDQTWLSTGSLNLGAANHGTISILGLGQSGTSATAFLTQDALRFNLTLVPVPEAAEGLMLLSGLAVLGIALRRRR